MKIAVLMTCHNRRKLTEQCLRLLKEQQLPLGVDMELFLMDDGSSDGTADSVRNLWPAAHILAGNGSLFWCGGMRAVWREARVRRPDCFLLLNDDTMLEPHAVNELIEISAGNSIAVGAICDPESGGPTYGGLQAWNAFPSAPTGRIETYVTFNGNCVAIPWVVQERLGMFTEGYSHSMADIDYGLMAGREGVAVKGSPGYLGKCARNSIEGTWMDRRQSRWTRLRKLTSPKGLPLSEWSLFCRRNLGRKWWRYALSPYLRVILGF